MRDTFIRRLARRVTGRLGSSTSKEGNEVPQLAGGSDPTGEVLLTMAPPAHSTEQPGQLVGGVEPGGKTQSRMTAAVATVEASMPHLQQHATEAEAKLVAVEQRAAAAEAKLAAAAKHATAAAAETVTTQAILCAHRSSCCVPSPSGCSPRMRGCDRRRKPRRISTLRLQQQRQHPAPAPHL